MTSPSVRSVTTTQITSLSTTHTINLPATIEAGDLILVIGGTARDETLTGPAGYTVAIDDSMPSVSDCVVYTKEAVGNEDSTTIDATTDVGVDSGWIAYAIQGADTSAFDNGTFPTSSTNSGDHPTVTPAGGLGDYLGLAICWAFASADNSFTPPSGYSNIQVAKSGTTFPSIHVVCSEQEFVSVSSINPGSTTWTNANTAQRTTVAISEGAAAGGGALPLINGGLVG